MRILGIDPGYATIGFGLITAERAQVHMVTYGAITTPAGLPLSRRLYQIGTDMEELIGQLKPDVISIEELFFNTNLTTGIAVAHARGVLAENSVVYRDLFDTELMGRLTPRPAQVIETFQSLYREDPKRATDWYYKFSQDTNYIRRDRIAKDVQWKTDTQYGELDITINLSKPEKDPKAIAAARNLPAYNYPR